MNTFNGSRLKEARYFNMMSITELASHLDVSKQMVSKYENGKSNPSPDVFFKIVTTLGFPQNFFTGFNKIKIDRSGTFYRSRMTATQKQKAPSDSLKTAAAVYRDYLNDFVEFPAMNEIDFEDEDNIAEKAMFLRRKWGLGENPIPNMIDLLESKGFVVVLLPDKMEKVDAFSTYVTVNNHKYYTVLSAGESYSFYRQQFTLAHELGHWALHADIIDPQELDIAEYKHMEDEANLFASNFLLPRESFTSAAKPFLHNIDNYKLLKKQWFVSIGAIVKRVSDLRLIDADTIKKFQKQISNRRWRISEPFDNTVPIARPTALKQATELVVDNNIVSPYAIPNNINEKYGIKYPANLLEKIAELPSHYMDYSNPSKVVQLKNKFEH
jgi:Zn-dependent peptidase ImmA (M78 family)/DNA-binding XRE family transcriptional regulator